MNRIEDPVDNKTHLLKTWKFILGIVLTFAGLDLIFMWTHLPRYTGLIFLVPGVVLLYYTLKKERIAKDIEKRREWHAPFLWKITFNGRMIEFFPIFGVFLILFDALYNIFYSSTSSIGSFDLVILFIAIVLIVYNFVPSKFSKERDFALIFGIFIFLLLIIPSIFVSNYFHGFEYSQSPIVFYLLVSPTTGLLNLIGISAHAKEITITYELQGGGYSSVLIAPACSGIWSMSLFISGFIAFVLVECKKINKKVGLFLIFGIFLAWFANILRMTIIIIVGSYYGHEAMLWAHKYLGEIIFIAWIALFWGAMFKFLMNDFYGDNNDC